MFQATLLNRVQDEGEDGTFRPMGAQHITAYFKGSGTITSGTVLIEEASIPATDPADKYDGAWSLLYAFDASAVTGDAQKAIHLGPGKYSVLRGRVSAAVVGGGVLSLVLEGA